MLSNSFELAAGSVPGRDHIGRGGLILGRNNQDSFRWHISDDVVIGVVADGCGSSAHSEIGATLGCSLLIDSLLRGLPRSKENLPESFWESVRIDFLASLRLLAMQLSGSIGMKSFVHEYLLFTTLGVLILPKRSYWFMIGDGIFVLNGRQIRVGPFPDNMPPYAAYELLRPVPYATPQLLRFITDSFATDELHSILVGTDGVLHLAEAAGRNIPGQSHLVGPLDQFWTEDRYFTNTDAVRRRLALVNSECMRFDRARNGPVQESGLLPDDTTLLVIRRKGGDPHA